MISCDRIERVDINRTDRIPVNIYHPDSISFIRRNGENPVFIFPGPDFSRGNNGAPRSGGCSDDEVTLRCRGAAHQSHEEDNSNHDTGKAGVHGRDR
jgi:hypothetical protein